MRTVLRDVEVPWSRSSDTVFAAPVVGSQVMLNGVSTVISVGVEAKVKGFCAVARQANVVRRRVERCILSVCLGDRT